MSAFLSSEAFAVYVTFVLTSIAWLVVQYRSRRKPSFLRVVQDRKISLLTAPQELAKDVSILYRSTPVRALHQTTLKIINRGETTIEHVAITILYRGKVIDVLVDDAIAATRHVVAETKDDSEIQVNADFVDPVRPLDDKFTLIVLSEGELQIEGCNGGGKGWRVEYVDMVKIQYKLASILASADPRNPVWVARYLIAATDLVSKKLLH